jgi:hypothetical protein
MTHLLAPIPSGHSGFLDGILAATVSRSIQVARRCASADFDTSNSAMSSSVSTPTAACASKLLPRLSIVVIEQRRKSRNRSILGDLSLCREAMTPIGLRNSAPVRAQAGAAATDSPD